jgi:hypothetical protein
MNPYGRYLTVMLGAGVLLLGPIAAANYVLVGRSFGGERVARAASEWQAATHGVTYAPPFAQNRPFKVTRLEDRLPDINAVVLGSSTAMGITASAFPRDIRIYNFSQSANLLGAVVGEAEALAANPNIKWIVVPLDWAVGLAFTPGGTPPAAQLLGPAAVNGSPPPGVLAKLADALSAPRVRDLFRALRGIVRAPDRAQAFRAVFFAEAGEEYRCADGTPARDYDSIYRGRCVGFRYDGSATFGNLKPLTDERAAALLASAVLPESPYVAPLVRAKGEVPAEVLDRLAKLAPVLRQRGGDLIVLVPPLMPGLQRAIAGNPAASAALAHWSETLAAWAVKNGVAVLDAGASENYGCLMPEFVDEHHTLPACYEKVFGRYWADRAAKRVRPGVYTAAP